jgi:Tfp pilus assembly protein PilF
MSSPKRLVIAVSAFLVLSSQLIVAQAPGGIGATGKLSGTVQVRVVLSNDRPAGEQLQVDLITSSGAMVAAMFTNSNGVAYFSDVAGGAYRLRVSGIGIDEATSGSFFFDPREQYHTETVVVQPRTEKTSSAASGASVPAVELSVPKSARKAVDKGVEAFNDGNFDKAREQFEKAIEQYPNFATAYNLLGLTFLRQKDIERGQQAFEKAIELNDHFGDAYLNLAKIYFRQQKYDQSEPLLQKSVDAQPRNPEALTYLAQLQLLGGKYEQAAANARRVHDLPHKEYAIVHFIAARALVARKQRDEAVTEYKLFLHEDPANSKSQQARDELAQLEAQKPQ